MEQETWEVPLILMQPTGDGQVSVQHVTGSILPKNVGTIIKANIPSKMSDSSGAPIATEGVKINVMGEPLFVSMSYKEFCNGLNQRL